MTKNTILVVDDEPEIRSLLSRFLGKKGFSVMTAGTLREGREIFREIKPALVFLDVNLPDGNGLSELKQINFGQNKSKVILMSAFDHREVKTEALAFGAIDFLSKPFNIARLDQVVQSQLIISNHIQRDNGKDSGNR